MLRRLHAELRFGQGGKKHRPGGHRGRQSHAVQQESDASRTLAEWMAPAGAFLGLSCWIHRRGRRAQNARRGPRGP